MTIGLRIRSLRESKSMTLEELSKYVNVSRQTLSRYETGIISAIPSDKIELLAKALNTTPAYLMGWDEKKSLEDVDKDIADLAARASVVQQLTKLSPSEVDIVDAFVQGLLASRPRE